MLDYVRYFQYLRTTPLAEYAVSLQEQTERYFQDLSHGDYDKWSGAIAALPDVTPEEINLIADTILIGRAAELTDAGREALREQLMRLHPWRKGPFELFGLRIDTEWRSDLKWARLADHVDPLAGRLILDVGCGNGYYMLCMLGRGARAVVGVDPMLLFIMQFAAINRYVQTDRACVLPLRLEDLPPGKGEFDTAFSMGILYHRREPREHLEQLYRSLRPGGQLVLETLVLERTGEDLLVPEGRYAKMRNVWTIAAPDLLICWLRETGFQEVKLLDVTRTATREQRQTAWMTFESLADFLDPEDPNLTIEGYPAPARGLLLARK